MTFSDTCQNEKFMTIADLVDADEIARQLQKNRPTLAQESTIAHTVSETNDLRGIDADDSTQGQFTSMISFISLKNALKILFAISHVYGTDSVIDFYQRNSRLR